MTDDHGPDCACVECCGGHGRRFDDLRPGLERVFARLILTLGVAILLVLALMAMDARAQNFPRTPVTVVRVEQPAYAYLPNGIRLLLPAGTELDACPDANSLPMVYDPFSLTHRIPNPCVERPVFRDGFEG